MQNKENNKHNQNDELNDIINDYSQDTDLHQKIKEMKKQKEEQEAIFKAQQNDINPLTGNKYQSSIFEEPKKTSSFANISADTQVFETNKDKFVDDTMEKTLVIMNGKTTLESSNEEEEQEDDLIFVEDEEEEETEKSKFHLFSKRKIEDGEESEVEEIDTEKSKKINKIITYVIIIVIAFIILGGVFVGAKAVLNKFKKPNNSEITTEKLPQSGHSTKPTKIPNKSEESTENENKNVIDNSAKISSLKEQKSIYEKKKKNAEKRIKELQAEIKKDTKALQEKYKKVEEAQNNASSFKKTSEYMDAENNLKNIESQYNSTPEGADKEALKVKLEEAKAKMNEMNLKYTELMKAADAIYNEYKPASDNLEGKTKELAENENIVKSMSEEIKNIDNQLRELH